MHPLKELPPDNQAFKDKFLIHGAKVQNGTFYRQPTNQPVPACRSLRPEPGPTRDLGPAVFGVACERANASLGCGWPVVVRV